MYKIYTRLWCRQKAYVIQFLRIMKILIVLMIAFLTQVSAATFAQKITLHEKNASLLSVFEKINKQCGFNFLVDIELLNTATPINIAVKNEDVQVVLAKIFANQPLSYSVQDKAVLVSRKQSSYLDKARELMLNLIKNIDLKGRILDEKAKPLYGASVSVQGGNRVVTTNDKGEFTLTNVDENAVIQVSFVGYKNRYIAANKIKSNPDIYLEIDAAELDEVQVMVNTGYQTLSKERSAGSFAKPDIDILRNRSGSTNILQRLDGLVPGLTVNNAPSASDNPLLVRGLSTLGFSKTGGRLLTNRNPLYVVDGIPLDDVSMVNPQDVDDITVLRDATAASIWGARASNGVIIIATKKGVAGDKVKIQYDSYVNLQGRPDFSYIPTLNSKEFIQAAEEVFDPVVYPWAAVSSYPTYYYGVPPHERILYNRYRNLISGTQARSSLDSLAGLNNTSQIKDLWYRPAMLMNHTLSVSGGSDKYTFYVSGAFTDIKSNRPGEANRVFKINGRQDFRFGERVKLSLITDLSNNVSSSKQTIDVDNRFLPYQLFKDHTGRNLSMPYMQQLSDETRIDYQNLARISLDYNPLDEYNYNTTSKNDIFSRNILSLGVKVIKGLRFEGTYSYMRGANRAEVYNDLKSYGVRSELVHFTVAPNTATTPVYYLPSNGGTYAVDHLSQKNWTVRNQLVYDLEWNNSEHQLTLLAGQEAQEQFTMINGSKVRGYNTLLQTYGPVDYATLGNAGLDDPVWANGSSNSILSDDSFRQEQLQTRFTSYYSNVGYTYSKRYSLNASIRFDRSNLFGLDKAAQNRPVYSIGGKWELGAEEFMKGADWLDQLALRATYGITGNSPSPGTAASYDVIGVQPSPFFPGGTGAFINTASNPHLSWERTSNINLGLDFSMLNNRLQGSIDLYRKNTDNLIGSMPTNGFTGYSTIVGNVGDMQNKGVELSLRSLNIQQDDFSWSTALNISYNKNQVTKFNPFTAITTGSGLINQNFVEGYPAFAVFAYQYVGLDNLGDPLVRLADGSVTKTPKITKPQDLKYMGTYQPVWNGGLSNVFKYKAWALSVNTVFNFGNVMRRDVNQFYTDRLTQKPMADFTSGNVNSEFTRRWRVAGDEATTNIPSYLSNASLSQARRDVTYYTLADANVVSAAYLKMRDATLSYQLNAAFLKKIAVEQVTLRAQVSNVMLWKANKYGIDPEYHYAPTGARELLSNQGTLSFGLNVRF